MSLATFQKDADARLDFEIDWTAWLGADTISGSTWIAPTPLSVYAETNTDTRATVWLEGGVVGRRYKVVNRITTANGRVDDRSITIEVIDR